MSTFIELLQYTFNRVQGKIPVRGTLITPSGSETFPIVLCNEIMGGTFIVNHIDELKSIPLERLLKGCKCTVNEFTGSDGNQISTTTYQLSRLPQTTDFTEFPVLVDGIPTGETYNSLDVYNDFWILDAPKQQELGTLQYQYSDNYLNKQPPYTEPAITKENYQLGYADNSGEPGKLIWSDTFDAGVHKWQRQKIGELSDWSIPVSITTTFEENDFIDTIYQWTENDISGPVNPGAPSSLVDGHSNSSPVGWYDVPPTPPTDYTTYILTHSLWETSATKDGYYNLKSVWSTPKLISTNPDLVRYGQNYNALFDPMSSEWHVFYEPNDIFKASRSSISDPWVIGKISQESGEYTDGVYKAFPVDQDPAPDGLVELAPTSLLGYGENGWQDGPFVTEAGYILYKSECRKRANGTQVTAWGGPIKANGDSTVRVVIVPQGTGESMFKYTRVNGSKVVTPTQIVLGVEVYDGINKLILGTLPSQYSISYWSKGGSMMYTSASTITVLPEHVVNTEVYGVRITYGLKTYDDFITLSDATDGVGYIANIYSETGFTYKDSVDKTFQAQLYENGEDITTATNLTCVWKLGGVIQTNSGSDRDIVIPAVSVSGIASLTLEITKDLGTTSAVTYKVTETLTDIVDGAALVRYYSNAELTPSPLTPSPGELPITSGITWTTDPTGAIWVVERLSNTLVWNAAYRVKGEKGVPNGGFQKTIYKVTSTGAPATPVDGGSSLTPVGWLETPPATMTTGDTTYGSTAMFLKNPANSNMSLDRANWIISGVWSTPFPLTSSFVGGTGSQGIQGYNGWSPQVRLEPFTGSLGQSFIAHYLYAWIGGTGTAPTTVGYLTSTGISSTATDSCNIRGLQGSSTESTYWEDSKVQVYNIYNIYGDKNLIYLRKSLSGMVSISITNNASSGTWFIPGLKYCPAECVLPYITGTYNHSDGVFNLKYSISMQVATGIYIYSIVRQDLDQHLVTATYTHYTAIQVYPHTSTDLTASYGINTTYRALPTSTVPGKTQDEDYLTTINFSDIEYGTV